ncbi:cytochrome b5-like Heme/Steroid binding domain containing protein, partial [Plasmodium malariae]
MEDNNKLKPVNVDGNSCNELLHKSLRSANQMLYANLSEGFKNDEQEDPSTKTFTVEEVAKHNTEKDAWVIYNKKVYDITHYIKYHPG